MATIQYNGTGRRKRAVARVIIRPGSGKFIVNGRPLEEYFFGRSLWLSRVKEPLDRTSTETKLDIIVLVDGGGIKGQADAIRMGLARALVEFDFSHKAILKPMGMLTRDAREVERKHYYKHKARKSPQYSKR